MVMRWIAAGAMLLSAPVFAQSPTGTFVLDRTSSHSVREYVATDVVPTQLELPPNLLLSAFHRSTVEAMIRQSPTFRRQCMRIEGEPRLTIQLNVAAKAWRPDVRAMTRIQRRSAGRLIAVIDIFPLGNHIELIAHEIEHVIEQLDEVDLASRAALRDTAVRAHHSDPQLFETTRATKVGVKVAGEVRTFESSLR